jgi:hypothetical protein
MTITARDARGLIHSLEDVLIYINDAEYCMKNLKDEVDSCKEKLNKIVNLIDSDSFFELASKKQNEDETVADIIIREKIELMIK